MANPYALGRSGDYNYNVAADSPEYAESPSPDITGVPVASDDHNGYIDNPAAAGAPFATTGQDTYAKPVPNPTYEDALRSQSGTRMGYQRPSGTEWPSSQRLQDIPLCDRRPDVGPPEDFWRPIDEDTRHRNEVTRLQATEIPTDVGVSPGDRRWKDNPRRDVPAEPRVTSRASQSNFRYTRPFDQYNRTYDGQPPTGSSRHLTGEHFSMADHRRKYDILGMRPAKVTRNTYRLDPAPWDEAIVDMPPGQMVEYPGQAIQDVGDFPRTSSAWRLT